MHITDIADILSRSLTNITHFKNIVFSFGTNDTTLSLASIDAAYTNIAALLTPLRCKVFVMPALLDATMKGASTASRVRFLFNQAASATGAVTVISVDDIPFLRNRVNDALHYSCETARLMINRLLEFLN
jgi:hypothetical protein